MFAQEAELKDQADNVVDAEFFTYNDFGVDIKIKNQICSIRWKDIERVEAYKIDCMTTDMLCVDITFNGNAIVVTEDNEGLCQFLDKLKSAVLRFNDNWQSRVFETPFKYNHTKIYERTDRIMPPKSNFYSIIYGKTKEKLSAVFENNGWVIRRSSMNNFSFENSWTALDLDQDDDSLLLHRIVAYHSDNVKIINQIFSNLNTSYRFEFYDENIEIIEEGVFNA